MRKSVRTMRWVVWILAVAFYFYEYLPRVSISVMVEELEVAFAVQAWVLGTLSSLYLFAYAPMQLPVGLMMDRFGARRLLTFAAIGVGISTLFFGLAKALWFAELTRFVMGGASAFAFIGMIYVCSHWFEDSRLAIMIGLGNSLGMLGAVAGEGPLSFSIEAFGWRPTMIVLGCVGVLLGVFIYLVVRNEPPEMAKHAVKPKKSTTYAKTFKAVIRNKWSWLNGLTCLFFYATTGAFAALWGVPFLQSTYGLSKTTAGLASSMFYLGTIIAGPIVGFISDKIRKRKPMLLLTTFCTLITVIILIYVPNLNVPMIFILFFLSGVFSCGQLLNFSLAIELNHEAVKGTAIAFTNFLVFMGSAALQPLVGFLLDLKWTGKMVNNVPVYSAFEYKYALICFPITLLIAFILSLFLRDEKDIDPSMYKEIARNLK